MADLTALLVTASFRIVGICTAAWLVTLMVRRSSAAARHMVWACAIATAMLTPVLLQLPTWPVVLPAAIAPWATSAAAVPTGAPAAPDFALIVGQPVIAASAPRDGARPRHMTLASAAVAVWASG